MGPEDRSAVEAYMPSLAKKKVVGREFVVWDYKGEEGNSHGHEKQMCFSSSFF